MTCDDVRTRLLDYQHGRLPLPAQAEVRTHLDACADCARAEAVEQELTSVLEHRLPQYPASLALKRRLAARMVRGGVERSWWGRWRPALVPALAVMSVVLCRTPRGTTSVQLPSRERAGQPGGRTVNDHLRVLSSQHPLGHRERRLPPW